MNWHCPRNSLAVQTRFDFREDAAIFGLCLTSGLSFFICTVQSKKELEWKGNKVREARF
jgi:hypothetical protein